MRNVKTWGILFLCLLLLPGVAYAQKRQIEGTVISQEDKEPLIGATVIVKGSLSGAETDLDGHFMLEVDPDAKFIIVDYIGMKQAQVPIPKSGILNVALISREAPGNRERTHPSVSVVWARSTHRTNLCL